MTKIKVKLKCTNIAPLVNLDDEFENSSLKIGVFANNGCGKTFISRMFRLLEKPLDDGGGDVSVSNTDRLITMGKSNAFFDFRITNDAGAAVEDFTINLAKSTVPTIPATKYLYHIFNQDYVDENIRALDYEHTEDVQGFILGKTNIDLTEDNKKLKGIIDARTTLKNDLTTKIDAYISKYIATIANIKRLSEYSQYVSAEVFLTHGDSWESDLPKRVNDYITDFDKVKSVPENLDDISRIGKFEFPEELFSEILTILATTYTLSSFGEEFKAEMREKQEFVEKGIDLVKTSEGRCPFCKQEMDSDALSLIDRYNDFITNEEAKTIKRVQALIQIIEAKRKELAGVQSQNTIAINRYNDYKTKYIPSCENNNLEDLDIAPVNISLSSIKSALEEKHKDISVVVHTEDSMGDLNERIIALNEFVESNNKLIDDINWRKNSIGEENKNIRRNICKAAYNHWIEKYDKEQKQYIEYGKQEDTLQKEIEKKKASQKIEKKKLVAETIKKVLDYFFSGKYSLDEKTFRLVFHSQTLEKNQTKNVLSEGEKNIVAFAYYLGDTHTLIEKEDDYKKLFFIIDDPISSMDFTYVYTLSGVIRDIKGIFPKMERVRHIVLTHNSDFIRILYSNKILDKVMLLKNSALYEWNDNFTVPYINHLLDIYRVARKGEKATHTTANSIRHIIETIDKFESINSNEDSVKEFIRNNIPNDKKSYTYINDLSHGGWRTEQPPMTDDDYKEVCETIIVLVKNRYPNQVKYCEANS
jgi:hypothetical protein